MKKKIKWISLIIFILALSQLYYAQISSIEFEKRVLKQGFPSKSDRESVYKSSFTVTFLGVTTLLFDDGQTQWLVDGFFSRPDLFKLFFDTITPNEDIVLEELKKNEVRSLAAILPIHSHFDHALDAPAIAKKTGAVLIGSESTANIGRGYGLSEKQIRIIQSEESIKIGKFRITFILSKHSPDSFFEGQIFEPLVFPAKMKDFKMAECYSLLIEHEGRNVLVHGSAGFLPNALDRYNAEVVYLGIGTLGMRSKSYQESYWKNVVEAVGAQRVIVVHWDNFFKPITKTLVPNIWPFDNFESSMSFLETAGQAQNVDIRIPINGYKVNPFLGISQIK